MGLSPVSFTEINAYIQCTGQQLNINEILLIKKLSQAYLEGLNNTSPDWNPPYTPPEK